VEGEPLPDETPALCIIQSGGAYDFFTLKGVVENIVRLVCGAALSCTPAGAPYLHPGVSANLTAGGHCCGVMGEIAPQVAKSFGLDQKVYMAQINLNALYKNEKPPIRYAALPRFPAATRDLAVIVKTGAGAGDMMNDIARAGGKRLERVQLFDVYTGEQVEEGSKSLAYSLTLRAPDATMTDAEVDKVMAKILKALEQKYGAKLR
jgi:phenylalanyl-tRNA synthetase beta chain